MSKRTSKKSSKYTPITIPVDYLPETGEDGEYAIGVGTRHYVRLDINPIDSDGVLELNGSEARRLGRALLTAADRRDGAK